MTEYSFLDNLTLVDTNRQRVPKDKTPTGMVLRILATGEVYPSKELVEHFQLEYENRDQENNYGFDVVDSKKWTPTAELPRMLLLAVVKKREAKVDLFGTCRFNDDNTPKSSVLTQGSPSLTLLDMAKDFGYITSEQKYCDLQFVIDRPLRTKDGIYNLPKIIERGERAGEETYVRRDNITLYPVNTVENLKQTEQATVLETTN